MINKKTSKQLRIVFTIFLFSLCIKTTNAQGPNAPEAASFEPVDATDMVNLFTGSYTYVLPLLNVPSPEGGYPIALAYHGGIAMDQEASWVGLGWNLNPGAINRSVNVFPDDYYDSKFSEYFYDEGETQTSGYFGVSYVSPGGVSVGVNLSWGSHQSLGGAVSAGISGFSASFGTDGASVGLSTPGALSLGVSASTNGTVGASIGLNSNGAGFRMGISSGSSPTYSFLVGGGDGGVSGSLGFDFSSKGVGMSYSASISGTKNGQSQNFRGSVSVGAGQNTSFNTTMSQGDYSVTQSSSNVSFFVPTPIGIFDFSWGKHKIEYHASKLTEIDNAGALYKGIDVYEIPLLDSNLFDSSYNIVHNNPVFPALDKFNVQAQGLSGSMHLKYRGVTSMKGISKNRAFQDEYGVAYSIGAFKPGISQFYFDNEIASYLDIAKPVFHSKDYILNTILPNAPAHRQVASQVYSHGVDTSIGGLDHLRRSNHIEYYSNEEIIEGTRVSGEGLLLPIATGFDRSEFPLQGIGAYKITAADGKTYHYSLPVYNYEKVTRTFGMSSVHKGEPAHKAYLEKRELEPYATHWFLTAVTGPDFVDNGNSIADEGDLGYWVNFEYGLWDEAYVWQNPYGQEYYVDEEDPDVKIWVRGVKQQYFLDRIKTRTHTALFLKNEREDNRSPYWQYWSVDHEDNKWQNGDDYVERFLIPQHKTLRLDKILLVKNEHDIANKALGGNVGSESVNIHFPQSEKPLRVANHSMKNNVFDWTDNWQAVKDHAIKVICFDHTNIGSSVLAKGTPNTGASSEGRLTLNSISFDGKQGAQVMPPYKFGYINEINNIDYVYNKNDQDEWGYNFIKPEIWSLNEIKTPNGGKILVNYEPHKYKSLTSHDVTLRSKDKISGARDADGYVSFQTKSLFNLNVSDVVNLDVSYSYDIEYVNTTGRASWKTKNYKYKHDKYDGEGVVQEITLDDNFYIIKIDPTGVFTTSEKNISNKVSFLNTVGDDDAIDNYDNNNFVELNFNTSNNNIPVYIGGGGVRVESIVTTDDINAYTSRYKYGKNQDGIGWVSYIPFAPESSKEVPHSFELPAPKPMYEYVKHESLSYKLIEVNGNQIEANELNGSTLYQFNAMNQSSTDKVKYGEFYELNVNSKEDFVPSSNPMNVKYVDIAEFEIKDNLNSIGQLLSISSFNANDQLLNKVSNEYFQPNELPDNLGVTKEVYQTYKHIGHYPESNPIFTLNWYVNSSTRIKYPSLLKSSTELRDGIHYTTRFDNFDFISGQAKETYSFSSNGFEMKSVSEPAYEKYSSMGSKADDVDNKNMLSQVAQTLNYYKKVGDNSWKLSNAEVQTWKDWGANIWRKHKTFMWKGDLDDDGSYLDLVDFNWNGANAVQDENWQKLSEITRYNDFSNVTEVVDINNNYASTKMCDNKTKVLVTGNAAYTEMFYSGAEYFSDASETYFDGQVKASSRTTSKAHTGSFALSVSSGQNVFESEVITPIVTVNDLIAQGVSTRKFKISVWIDKATGVTVVNGEVQSINAQIDINNALYAFNVNEAIIAGEWVLLNAIIELPRVGATVSIKSNTSTYLDDFRLHPIASSMISYVYNEWDELWYIIGNNGLASKFEYDKAGRLKTSYTEVADFNGTSGSGGFKKINENSYNYKHLGSN